MTSRTSSEVTNMSKSQIMVMDMGDLFQLAQYYKSEGEKEIFECVLALQIVLSNVVGKQLCKEKDEGELVHGLNAKERACIDPTRGVQGKIPAIKLVRERTGMGLAEAKCHVEKYYHQMGYTEYRAW